MFHFFGNFWVCPMFIIFRQSLTTPNVAGPTIVLCLCLRFTLHNFRRVPGPGPGQRGRPRCSVQASGLVLVQIALKLDTPKSSGLSSVPFLKLPFGGSRVHPPFSDTPIYCTYHPFRDTKHASPSAHRVTVVDCQTGVIPDAKTMGPTWECRLSFG